MLWPVTIVPEFTSSINSTNFINLFVFLFHFSINNDEYLNLNRFNVKSWTTNFYKSPQPKTRYFCVKQKLMWKMFDTDLDCSINSLCGDGGPGPPKFHIPPPPRPAFLISSINSDTQCSENPSMDMETCAALPVSSSLFSTFWILKWCQFPVAKFLFIGKWQFTTYRQRAPQ